MRNHTKSVTRAHKTAMTPGTRMFGGLTSTPGEEWMTRDDIHMQLRPRARSELHWLQAFIFKHMNVRHGGRARCIYDRLNILWGYVSLYRQWLKCNGMQGNAVPPLPVYGSGRSPASDWRARSLSIPLAVTTWWVVMPTVKLSPVELLTESWLIEIC